MIYVHVPFCKSRCIYCDFYSTTADVKWRQDYPAAISRELASRHAEIHAQRLSSLYLGGGTPSWLGAQGIEDIVHAVRRYYTVDETTELTVECNPDDITAEFAAALQRVGVNRVSLGVQTFSDECLRRLGRRHSAGQARDAVLALRDAGINNLSIDLIYGLPGRTLRDWQHDVSEALALPVQHLSAYSLMYEPGTRLTALRDAGRIVEVDEDLSLECFRLLRSATRTAGFEHYEISNFARPGFRSRHNSAYWSGCAYVGLGPGAHSFDGKSVRRSNDTDLSAYMLTPEEPPFHSEQLTPAERQDEHVFTALRTAEGISLQVFTALFGRVALQKLLREAAPHLENGRLQLAENHLSLTERGLFVSDDVMSDLMIAY